METRHRWLLNLFFAFVGFALLLLAFKDIPLQGIFQTLRAADFRWAILVVIISTASHLVRAMRWRLLIAPFAPVPTLANAFWSLMLGYVVSLAVPRLGEISRCAALNRTSRVPFSPLFGSVITERITDISCLAVAIVLAFLVESENFHALFANEVYPDIQEALAKKSGTLRTVGIVGVIVFALLLAYLLSQWRNLHKKLWIRKFRLTIAQVWKGVCSIAQLEKPWLFATYTLAIWLSYYGMTYLWFFSFEATSGLGWQAGLAMMAIGSVGRSMPVQGGGAGAYHYLFIQGIMLYGIGQTHGAALALLIHGVQTCYMLLAGGLAMLVLGKSEI